MNKIGNIINRKIPDKPKRYEGKCQCGNDIYIFDIQALKNYHPSECWECINRRESIREQNECKQAMLERRAKDILDPKYYDQDFNDWKAENLEQSNNKDRCVEYVNAFEGWLIIYGSVGTGKTMMLNILAYNLITKKMSRVYMRDWKACYDDYLAIKQLPGETKSTEYIERITDHDVIILDEYARYGMTDAAREFAFTLINQIYKKKSRLVIGHNGDNLEYLMSFLEPDRVREMGEILHFTGQSRRGKKQKNAKTL